MKATGIVRRIDDLGRVVIPKEIRRTMRIREGDPSEITLARKTLSGRFCVSWTIVTFEISFVPELKVSALFSPVSGLFPLPLPASGSSGRALQRRMLSMSALSLIST